ncbi:NAD(P)H-hydrate dehydratase [Candidatus Bathyarchaeota archaeon]|nr:NAD(P)H-hydrate dehydratase [Candidatus Bathyarchaeota archaeon]
MSKIFPARPREARKGDYGRIIVAGGSERYAGCLAFNGLAALRAGADLSIIVAPRRAADIVAGYSPDLITVPCSTPFPEPRIVAELLDGADALIVGCGVVRSPPAHKAILSIVKKCIVPMVIDAEALHAIAPTPSACRGKTALLTPNAGEYRVLARRDWPSSREERVKAVKALSKQFGTSVIVKGSEDYISDGTRVSIDREGSPYLTKGGYGDLLAGIAAAMLARGRSPFEAAKIAAYLVGRAGRMASKRLGEGTLASDTLEQIPLIISRAASSSARM